MVIAAVNCGGGGDGHLLIIYVAVVLVGVKLYVVRTWYQVKGFCADAHRLTMKAISQSYALYNYRVD